MKLKKLLLPALALSLSASSAFAVTTTNYEIRLSSGAVSAPAEPTAPAIEADGSLNEGTATAVPLLTSNLSHGVASFSGAVNSNSWAVYTAFDQDLSGTGLLTVSNVFSGNIGYQFVAPKAINKYGILHDSGWGQSNSPGVWTFEASNDGVSWDILGTENKLGSSLSTGAFTYYTVSNSTAYSHYRLNVTGNMGGSSGLGVREISLIEAQ